MAQAESNKIEAKSNLGWVHTRLGGGGIQPHDANDAAEGLMNHKGLALAAALFVSACGPSWAPPNAPTTPCAIIGEAAYRAAREAGAAHGRAVIREGGMVTLDNGPGVVHCATYASAMKPCRRPNDYVIEYQPPDAATFYVLVPANAEYRFNVQSLPNTCQIVRAPN